MSMAQPKKLLILYILEILKKYSDEKHPLRQKDIILYLDSEYGIKNIDRKTVKRNLSDLILFGYDIEHSNFERSYTKPNGELEISSISTAYYLDRDITDGELYLLINSVIFSPHIPMAQSKQLAEKLLGLSSAYFTKGIHSTSKLELDKTENKQLFYNIELLDEAIRNRKKVYFKYNEYCTDKKLHKRKRPDGTDRDYKINPYRIVTKLGRYYLICNNVKYDNVSNFRIDRICDLEILNEPRTPYESLNDNGGKRLNVPKYMREHLYMFSCESVCAKFMVDKKLLSDVIDVFGKNIAFFKETKTTVCVKACVDIMSMEQFAKAFAPRVVVLEPKELADRVKNALCEALCNYENNDHSI